MTIRILRLGDRVSVPWGVDDTIEGKIVEFMGDHLARVFFEFEDPDDEPMSLLLNSYRLKVIK